MNLAEQVVLVTGAARRVGGAIAERLARAGCRIAVHYHTSQAEARQTVARCRAGSGHAEAFPADLSDPATAAPLVQAVLKHFGRLDALVNNASVFERMTLGEFDLERWEQTMRVNLTAPMALVHAARHALRDARGTVINLCDAATERPWSDHLAYAVSKGALETLTRALARALAPEVNVVGIAPGIVAWPEHYDQATRERLVSKVPLRRAGTVQDVAAAVEFILRDGGYMTGAVLPIDGGRHLA